MEEDISHSWSTCTNKLYMLYEAVPDFFSTSSIFKDCVACRRATLKNVSAGTTKNVLNFRYAQQKHFKKLMIPAVLPASCRNPP